MKTQLGLGFAAGGKQLRHIAAAGQSNMSNWWNGTTEAPTVLLDGLRQNYPNRIWSLENGAWSGSAVLKTVNGTKYWWDDSLDKAGNAFTNFVSNITKVPNYILWDQGQSDGDAIAAATISKADYKTNLEKVFNHFKSLYPQVKIFLAPMGRRANITNAAGWTAVRQAQWELIQSMSFVYMGAQAFDVTLADSVHYNDAGYETLAGRFVDIIGQIDKIGRNPYEITAMSGIISYVNSIFSAYASDWPALAGTDYTDGGSGQAPTYTATDFGGLGGVNAGDASTRIKLASDFSGTSTLTAILVADFSDASDSPWFWSLGNSSDGETNSSIQMNSSEKFIFYRDDGGTAHAMTGGGDTGKHLIIMEYLSDGTFNFYVDSYSTVAASYTALSDYASAVNQYLFSHNGSSARSGMSIQSHLLFNRTLSESEKQQVVTELARQAQISLS